MPSSKETRKQRHQAQIKTQPGKPIRGAQSTEFVKGAGYRKAEFVGSKKFYTPMSTDPTSSGAGGDTTNITISGGGLTQGAVLADGTVPFNNTQSGITPTESNHLATKNYVDNNATSFELTGDITGGTSGASGVVTTIANNAVENAMLADNAVSTAEIANNSVTIAKLQQLATDTFLGRNTSGTGNVEVITLDDLEAMLNLNSYLQSASTNSLTDMTTSNPSAGHYLRYNGTNYVNTTLQVGDISGLQASQIPVIDISSKTTGTLPVNRGGTGATSGYNSSNWNTAYGWGDHGAAGYMSSFIITETDAGTNTVNNGKYVKFASSNSGSHGNSTVTGSGSSGDPFVVTLNTPDTDTNTNQLTTFTLTADSGSNQTIAHGNTLDIEGGTGVSTVVGSTDKVTVSIGQSIGTSNSPTFAGLTLSSLSSQSSEATAVMINGSNVIGKRELGSAAFANTADFMGATQTTFTALTSSGDINQSGTASKFYQNSSNTLNNNSVLDIYNVSSTGYGLFLRGGANGTNYCQVWKRYDDTTIMTLQGNGYLRVGAACDSSSTAIAQFGGFVRMRDYMIIHDGSSSSNAVGWEYSNNALRTWSSGSGTKNLYADADVVAYYSSDPRLKENKKKIENPLKILDKINGYTFDWKNYAKNVGTHLVGSDYGVMADEIEEVMPELVHDRDNGYKGVKYEKIVPLLIECIKEQQVQINRLKKWKEDKKWI